MNASTLSLNFGPDKTTSLDRLRGGFRRSVAEFLRNSELKPGIRLMTIFLMGSIKILGMEVFSKVHILQQLGVEEIF